MKYLIIAILLLNTTYSYADNTSDFYATVCEVCLKGNYNKLQCSYKIQYTPVSSDCASSIINLKGNKIMKQNNETKIDTNETKIDTEYTQEQLAEWASAIIEGKENEYIKSFEHFKGDKNV